MVDREVLAVVVSYNNLALMQRAVMALRRQTQPVKIAVWDNASTDGIATWLALQPDVATYLSEENVFWTPAVNGTVEKFLADERFILWMNNDAAPGPTCVERLVNLMDSDSRIGLVAPATAMIGGPQDVANCDTYSYVAQGGYLDHAISDVPPKRCTYVLGACAMTRTDVWNHVGPLDNRMVLGADDHDWSIRVKDAGYQIWVAQNTHCDHQGHASASVTGGKEHWDDLGGKCWGIFNEQWAGYFHDENEAIRCHWDGRYFPFYDYGTGWLTPEQRKAVQDERDEYESAHPQEYK